MILTNPLGNEAQAFACPRCKVHSRQVWFDAYGARAGANHTQGNWRMSVCDACREPSLWVDGTLVFPLVRQGPSPHDDMPERVKVIYEEARTVAALSPKSAAALLRLALQHLVDELDTGNGNINAKIGRLVQAGLDSQVQQAMDVVRVVGNNGVHPGEIDLDEDSRWLPRLFSLVNIIVEQMITRPKTMAEFFADLPEGARAAIDRRDTPTT